MFHKIGLGIVLSWLASAAVAEIDVKMTEACIAQSVGNQSNPAVCIDAAQVACMDGAADVPAVAALCFGEARDTWSDALRLRIQRIVAETDETLAVIAQIETKYDLLSNLIQCDRVEELSLAASDLTGESIAVQKARCLATATGLTYLRLHLRARDLPDRSSQ